MPVPDKPTAAILSTGEEVLRGELIDSNSASLSDLIGEAGFEVTTMLTVGDRREDLQWALHTGLARADHLFISGGLGPTSDDLTSEVVAHFAGVDLVFDEASWAFIVGRFKEFQIPLTDNNRKQAMFPAGATILPNPNGTAPGFVQTLTTQGRKQHIVALPGPPREMVPMVTAYLRSLPEATDPEHLFIHFLGIGESSLGAAMEPWMAKYGEVGFRALFPEVQVKLYDPGVDARRAMIRHVLQTPELAGALVDFSNQPVPRLFATFLRETGQTFATAESCTGGLIGKLVTDPPGSSDYYLGGVIAYANRTKTALLGVDAALLAQHGAVSAEVAAAMAEQARKRLGSDLALSVTGIAGPGGGSDEKPVGTVWLGKATQQGTETFKPRIIPGRERVRMMSAYEGMRWLMRDWLATRWRAAGQQ